MAGNIFDQFDEPEAGEGYSYEPGKPREVNIGRPRAAANIFDQFDEPEPQRPSFASPPMADARPVERPQVAQASMAPPVPEGAGASLYQGHVDTQAAQRQHAAPLVRDRKGNFVRKVIGEIEEFDFGPAIRGADGNIFAFNPKTDVMLRDPESGRLMAFERDQGHATPGALGYLGPDNIDKPGLLTRIGQALLPGMVTGPSTQIASSNAVPMAVQRGAALGFPVPARTFQAGERARDAAAFGTLETPVFAPAFRSKGAARFARTVEELPVLGGIVKNPKTETELALKNAQARIASDLGAASTDEAAGRVLQGGLDRFRTARLPQLPARDVAAAGIDPFAPVQAGVATSRGAAARAEAAANIIPQIGADVARTSRGVEVPPARPLSEVYRSRTRVDDLSDAQLDQVARMPAQQTSFATRADALYERARRNLPPLFKRDGSVNPNEIATPNSQTIARGLLQQEQSARISGGVLDGRFGGMIEALSNPQAPFTVESLMASRREIGRALASFGEYDARLDRSQLNQIYAAISRDLEVGIRDLSTRAALGTRAHNQKGLQYFGPPTVTKGPNGETIKTPTQVSPEVARRAAQALRDFRVADRYYRGAISQMDRFTQLLDARSPEAAMRSLATRMKEGTIDRGLIRVVSDALHPEERNQVLGYLIARMGQRPGAQEAEHVWNLHAFATDWNKNKAALSLMAREAPAGVVDRLNALARVSERMKYYETTKNYSGSAYAGIPFAGALTGVVGGGPMVIPTLIASVGGLAAMGKFLTSPRYLDWMVKAAQSGAIPRAGGPQVGGSQVAAQLERLRMIAANDNELGPLVTQALELFRKRAVGADDENPEPQGQQQ
jgi:hypothetical protein